MGVSIFLAANSSMSCPVTALKLLVKSAKYTSSSSPLFSFDHKNPASRAQFLSRFKSKLSTCNIDASSFSGHSFRRGGAQSLYDAGIDIKEIQTLGRWNSDLVARRYFGTTKERLCKLSRDMASTPSCRPLRFESLKAATSTLPPVSTLFGRVRTNFGATSRH